MTVAPDTFIDLDLPTGLPASRPGATGRLRRRARVTVAAVAFALLLVLGADAIGEQPPRFAAPVDVVLGSVASWSMTDESVYALIRGELSAYRLSDGTKRWTVPVPSGTVLGGWELAGMILLVVPGEQRTVGYSEMTGERVWERPGMPNWGSADGTTIVIAGDDPVQAPDDVESRQIFTKIDVRTGEEIWSYARRFGRDSPVLSAGGAGGSDLYAMLHVDAAGSRLYDLDSGRERALPGDWRWAQLVDGLLVGSASRGGVTAYDTATLNPLWTLTEWNGTGRPCGPYLCLNNESGITAIDRVTGAVRWQSPLLAQFGSGDWIFAADRPDGPAAPTFALLDARTGLVSHRWTDRRPLAAGSAGWAPLVGTDPQTGRLDLFALDVDRRVTYPLGTVETPVETCRAMSARVACAFGTDRVRIWTYAPKNRAK